MSVHRRPRVGPGASVAVGSVMGVAWSVPMGYAMPGRGPGPMIAWATREVGWSFGFTGLAFAAMAGAAARGACLALSAIRTRPPAGD